MGKLIPQTSVVTFYRRSVAPAASLVSAAGTNPSPALDLNSINLVEGNWITFDANGNAIAITTPVALAFPVWVGGRTDAAAAGQITIIAGPHCGVTTVFAAAPTNGAYAVGKPLTVRNGQLDTAGAGEYINAICEGPPAGATADFPNGFLPYNTYGMGTKA